MVSCWPRGAGPPRRQRGQGGSEAAQVWPPGPLGLRDTGALEALEQGRASCPGSGPVCPAAVWRTGRRSEGGSGARLAGARRRSGSGDFPRRSRRSAPARLWVLRARGQGRLQALGAQQLAEPQRGEGLAFRCCSLGSEETQNVAFDGVLLISNVPRPRRGVRDCRGTVQPSPATIWVPSFFIAPERSSAPMRL